MSAGAGWRRVGARGSGLRRRLARVGSLGALWLSLGVALGQSTPPRAPSDSPAPVGLRENGPLAAMSFLAGACWEAPLPDGVRTDSRCIRWFQQGRYLRSRHEIRGSQPPYGGETTYFRDPEDDLLRSVGFDVAGATARGTVRVLADGAVQIDERHADSLGHHLQRIRYTPVDTNTIHARIERSDDDGRSWRVVNDARYLRKPINW